MCCSRAVLSHFLDIWLSAAGGWIEWKLDAKELREISIMLINCHEKCNLGWIQNQIKIQNSIYGEKIVSMFITFLFSRILSGLLSVDVILQRAGNFGLDYYNCGDQVDSTSTSNNIIRTSLLLLLINISDNRNLISTKAYWHPNVL